MKDFNMEIYNTLTQDKFIKDNVSDRNIMFNKYPDTFNLIETTIVIDEIDDFLNEAYGDDKSLAMSQIIQVDVFVKANSKFNARLLRNKLAQRISDLLEENLRMSLISSNKPEYDDDLKIYRSARRYEGVFVKDIVSQ